MMDLKKGDFCVRLITVMGSTYACPATVDKVGPVSFKLDTDELLTYSRKTGEQDGGPRPFGGTSRVVEIDGGQIEATNWISRLDKAKVRS